MLTPQSIHMIHVINKMPFVSEFLETYNKPFTKTGFQFLETLLTRLEAAQEAWKAQKAQIMESRIIRGQIPKSTDFNYMPSEIGQLIDETSVLQNTYTMIMPSRTFTIDIVLTNNHSAERQIRNVLYKVFLWFHLADGFTSSTCSSRVHVYLYLTSHTKRLPIVKTTVVSQLHVNTAFTTGCQTETTIHVYRKEEWFKVLIHESFHNLGLDFLGIDPNWLSQANDQLKSWFHLNIPDLRFYESYCEMWAEILNALMYCFFTHRSKKGESDKIIKSLHTCLTYESVFSMLQCAKLLRHNGLSYEDFFKDPEKVRQSYKENTQAFSYFVIKGIYMIHFVDFVHLVAGWKTLKFPHNKKEFFKYLKLVKDKMKSNKMVTGMKCIENWLHAQTPSQKSYELCTLRMSLLEFI